MEISFSPYFYVNEKKKICVDDKGKPFFMMEPHSMTEMANALYENPAIIDKYVKEKVIVGRKREILLSWKRVRTDNYYIERHHKDGSILINDKGDVYKVLGITTSLEEMTAVIGTPCLVKGAILPFENVLITDGLISF